MLDGLKAEREQGITIDVAYRYFSTANRKFIIADTPGHEQYTRNMVTGASTANLAIILIDARKGVITQTKRHTFLVSLLGIKHIVLAVNKMDLMDYSEEVFNSIVADYKKFTTSLSIPDMEFIPLSALNGDNVVDITDTMPWYKGKVCFIIWNRFMWFPTEILMISGCLCNMYYAPPPSISGGDSPGKLLRV